ncbi:MAG: hypothetical protein M1840_004339 [Geoglossum simile]|nr:MAG: hypothetical protein M1840_004339 [Geoglossum simile]
MLPDSNFYELLENHHGDAWKDEELGKRLRERLGTDYPPYKSSVRQLNKKIVLFSQKLKLCDDMRPSWVTSGGTINEKLRQNFFKNPWIRIKGGFDSNKYAKLLAEIDRDINQLHTLTKGAESLEPIRLDRKRRANAAYWIDVRDQARRLFEALRSRWSCSCPCRHPHRAHLRLDVRSGKEVGNSTTRFGLLFSFDVNAAVAASLPWNWRDIEIEPFQAPNNQ